jgi:hypothetical protein
VVAAASLAFRLTRHDEPAPGGVPLDCGAKKLLGRRMRRNATATVNRVSADKTGRQA